MYKKILIFVLIALSLTFVFVLKNQNGNKQVTRVELEKFLSVNNPSEEVKEAYRFALENPQGILSKVKCYCGCIKNNQHESNRECFFKKDGSIDLMGLNCGLCVKTALVSKQMLAEGKTIQEISDYVDIRWGKE